MAEFSQIWTMESHILSLTDLVPLVNKDKRKYDDKENGKREQKLENILSDKISPSHQRDTKWVKFLTIV